MLISILWHHHQPIYRNPLNTDYVLPWVNFHLTKNYYQMAFLAEEQEYPCTFNLVPCLLEQVADYCLGRADDPLQDALEQDPGRLTSGQVERLAKLLPQGAVPGNRRELQLMALRALFSPVLETGRDKDELLEQQKTIWKRVIPYYKSLWKNGLIELTTSAYYHPLLPLIFDLSAGGETLMPRLPFRHPEDGVAQIKNGREYFQSIFGDYPKGLWPSEGGVSQEVAHAAAVQGFQFVVTDENVLWKALNTVPSTQLLYRPYTCQNLTVFFRDRELSDLLSFEYWRWPEKDAVSHLLAKIKEKSRGCSDDAVCVIALDGENPWAGFRENGVPFLRELYSRLKEAHGITPTFLESCLARVRAQNELNLVPGTWMGNFSKWVGSPAKNAAWERLARARARCGPSEDIYIAEGSDWFWWFGEGNVAEFESLFDGYLKKAQARERKKHDET